MHHNIWEDRPDALFFDYLEAQDGFRVIETNTLGTIMQRPLGTIDRREKLPKRAQL